MSLLTSALWTWTSGASGLPMVATGYPSGYATKTGLKITDLQNFIGIPLQYYNTNPPVPVAEAVILQWLRWAEDWVEAKTGLLLTQTWVASPPAFTPAQAQAIGITTTSSGGYQVLGEDYDIEDAAYDFFFPRAQDEGWMIYSMRYKPVKDTIYGPQTPQSANAIKNISYVYPLLNEFFAVPPSWQVEDHDFGLVRLVPSANVQMLPLFAMQLAFMGFAESVPGAIWFQYKAGLTQNDYNSRWSFIYQLVLAQAAITALQAIQSTINMGALEYRMFVDGLQYSTKFSPNGPLGYLMDRFMKMRDEYLSQAVNKVTGPVFTTF
jgi:hypothetical protein